MCNGCGIRWRRVSGTEGRRIRPGPKATSTNTIPSFSSNIATPATFKPRNDAFRGNSSGGCTPPRKSGKGLTKSTEKLEPSSKMALKHLLCDTTAWRDGDYYRIAVGHHTPRPRSAESASMRINNLIDGDGRGSGDGRRAMSVDSSFQLPPSIRWRQ